jgi:hypothetical protein
MVFAWARMSDHFSCVMLTSRTLDTLASQDTKPVYSIFRLAAELRSSRHATAITDMSVAWPAERG